LTANIFVRDEVDFRLVVEEQEHDDYAARYGDERVLVLPFANLGQGSIPARNWIKEHSIEHGAKRHWQFDDNIRGFARTFRGRRVPIHSGLSTSIIEDFTDRYTNIAISGFNYRCFVMNRRVISLNCHVYSATLVLNEIPYKWRGRYNEDTDLCLQALAGGWCTVLVSAFTVDKIPTMMMKGGNTAELYVGDGRLKMARALERMWPGVVEVKRRFDRPQHVIVANWRKFDTPLQRRTDIEWPTGIDEYGMTLHQTAVSEHPRIKEILSAHNALVSDNRPASG